MPTRAVRTGHLVSVAILMGTILAALVGCAPESRPSPSPTLGFSTEAEAFAAAEEVYRAYNDALNANRAGDAEADPTELLTGLALESELNASQYLDQRGLKLTGIGEVAAFQGNSANIMDGSVQARVCLDVSATRLIASDGTDETPLDRLPRVPMSVTFVTSEQGLLIANSNLIEGEEC